MNHRQIIPAAALAIALATCAYGFLRYSTASIPYPDPTPELLLQQARELHAARNLALGAGLVSATCLLWLLRMRKHGK
jgi:hypothetical protein